MITIFNLIIKQKDSQKIESPKLINIHQHIQSIINLNILTHIFLIGYNTLATILGKTPKIKL